MMIETLTEQQQRLLTALQTTGSVGQAARCAGISERAARRWVQLPAFQTALEQARQEPERVPMTAEIVTETEQEVDLVEEVDMRLAVSQIVEKATAQKFLLEQETAGCQETIEILQAEKEQLLQEQLSRHAHVADLETQAAAAHEAHRQARNYASIASETLAASKARASANEKQREDEHLQFALLQAQKEALQAEQIASARLAEISDVTTQLELIVQESPARLADIEQVAQSATLELGEHEWLAVQKQMTLINAEISAAKEALSVLEMRRQEFANEAKTRLALWTEKEKAFVESLPPDTATSRIIQSCIDYLDVLLDNHMLLSHHIATKPYCEWRNGEWWQLLQIDNFLTPLGTEAGEVNLKKKRNHLQKILNAL